MATDKSQPRAGLILKVGVLAIASLVAIHAALVAYFDRIAQAEEHRKFGEAKPEALMNIRAYEKERLTSSPVPIDKAMQQLATRGRTAASPDIMPTPSPDTTPLKGWVLMPGEVPPTMVTTDAGSAGLATDAGVTMAVIDGAVPKTIKPERGDADGGPAGKPPTKTP
jgi:hypothetical protein